MSNIEVHDIVLAEDDRDDVDIFKTALNESDIKHELRHAENGEVLFVLLNEKIPYILFLDIEMPCKDGMACIKELRSDSRYDNMPVIVYSSHSNKDYVDGTFRHGANLYLRKRETIGGIVADLKNIFSINWAGGLTYPAKNDFIIP